MYELRIDPFQDIIDAYSFIHSTYLPRKDEIIENYKFVTDDGDIETTYTLTLQVTSVHFSLYQDLSSHPIVYAQVINCEKQEVPSKN